MMIDLLTDIFARVQQQLFEVVVQPLMFALGGASLLEDGFAATGWLLVGLLQIAVMLLLIAPLERWRPVQRIADRQAVRVDVAYTLLHRLGLVRVGLFFAVDPLWDALWGWLAVQGVSGFQLDALVAPLWPGVTDAALAGFLVYLVVFDLADYLLHRAQHQFNWWWQLHALHHSQRQMTMWSDNRNHLLDDLIARQRVRAAWAGLWAWRRASSWPWWPVPSWWRACRTPTCGCTSGRLGNRLLVSPRFHRLHHSVGLGHESAGRAAWAGTTSRCCSRVGPCCSAPRASTIRYGPPASATSCPRRARDYGRGFWAQQWLGCCAWPAAA
jgi:sterol desaturase/sphingolipid hydroxylase (fatty acid hydroxylase superfamily)